MSANVFVDIETTGLSYEKQVFDVAMIRVNPDGTEEHEQFFLAYEEVDSDGYEYSTEAEKYNHIERYSPDLAITEDEAVERIERIFRGCANFIGMVPDFDANALWKLIRKVKGQRAAYPWYYQLVDIDMVMLGYFRAEMENLIRENGNRGAISIFRGLTTLPFDTSLACSVLGVAEPPEEIRHTAMGDAEWVKRLYSAIMG